MEEEHVNREYAEALFFKEDPYKMGRKPCILNQYIAKKVSTESDLCQSWPFGNKMTTQA